jgi:hypothetical protein
MSRIEFLHKERDRRRQLLEAIVEEKHKEVRPSTLSDLRQVCP